MPAAFPIALRIALGFVVIAALGAGVWYWLEMQRDELPEGFAVGNGRIEAVRVNVSTKHPGRIDEVLAEEGEWVERRELLVRMDASEVEAQLREAEASVRLAHRQRAEAAAELSRRNSELALAAQELSRTRRLFEQGHVPQEGLDQRTTAHELATAAVEAAEAALAAASEAIEAAEARKSRLEVVRSDHELRAPRAGRVQHRLAEPGEVLAGGAPVLALLDLHDVFMAIFLPTRDAGRVALGAEARIVLDAAPEFVVPAQVTFVASEAQFTPRHVETAEERDRLMFRVKVQVPRPLLAQYAPFVKTGLPGVAYVRIDPDAEWPAALEPRLPGDE